VTARVDHEAVAPPDAEPAPGRRVSFASALSVIALVALAIRVGYALWRRDAHVWGDPYFYHESAKLIADGEGFITPFRYLVMDIKEQAADHPPLYLLYLAFWTMLGADSPLWHSLLSVPLGVASVVLVGLTGRRVAGERVGLLAAGLAAVYPNVWGYDGMILSETVAILMVSATLLAAYRYHARPSTGGAALLGVIVGLAALSRSELLLLSVLVVVPLVLGRDRRAWPSRFPRLMLAGVACLGVIAPWVAFNLSRFDEPVLLSAGAEVTLSTATCDDTYYGALTGYWSLRCPNVAMAEEGVDPLTSDQPERSEAFRTHAIRYMRDHLDRLPAVVLARWGRIVGLYRPTQQVALDQVPEGREPFVAWSSLLMFYGIAGFAVVGAISLRCRRRLLYPLLAPPLIVWIVVTVMFATNRYRASAEVALCLLAAVGIDALWRLHERVRADPDDEAERREALRAG
jgi:4-amino-4-deoxy-L-arabinose transferase-like glycosyltransferase